MTRGCAQGYQQQSPATGSAQGWPAPSAAKVEYDPSAPTMGGAAMDASQYGQQQQQQQQQQQAYQFNAPHTQHQNAYNKPPVRFSIFVTMPTRACLVSPAAGAPLPDVWLVIC